jgi:hypothetical protein
MGGSEDKRKSLLDSVTTVAGDLEIYDVVTPEIIHESVNIEHFDYRRSSDHGVGLIEIDVWVTEIRAKVKPAFSKTKDPSGADPQSGGVVNPVATTPGQNSSVKGKVQ